MPDSLLSAETRVHLVGALEQELTAANTYLNMANQMQFYGLFGAQKYFLKEHGDELSHYQKLAKYFNDRSDVADVPGVKNLTHDLKNIGDALKQAYNMELELGRYYETIYAKVDITTQQFILKFIEIQRKSVGEYGDLIARYALTQKEPAAILVFDEYMGSL